jgi:hypothetical protein
MIGRLRRWLAGRRDLDASIGRHPASWAVRIDQLHLMPTSELITEAVEWLEACELLDGDDLDPALAAALRDRAAQFRANGD